MSEQGPSIPRSRRPATHGRRGQPHSLRANPQRSEPRIKHAPLRRAAVHYPYYGGCPDADALVVRREHWPAQVQEISTRGIGVSLRQRIEPGNVLAVELHSPDQTLSYVLLARVATVIRRPDGDWLLCCQFGRELDADEVQNLL